MKKKLLLFIAVMMFLAQSYSCALAKGTSVSNPVRIAIKKYKAGNYTGCLQDCLSIVKNDPSNSIVYYYMAMSYVQAGQKDAAVQSYSKVLSLNPNSKLLEYATTGKRCLETPDKCKLETTPGTTSDMDKFIATPSSDGLSNTVRADFEQKRLDGIRNEINNGKDVDGYELKNFKDYSNHHSQVEVKNENITQKKPSSDEIIAALKTLNDAGLAAYAQQAQMQQVSPQAQVAENAAPPVNPYAQPIQTPEQSQLNMLMGGNSQSGNNNAMMNMIPFMIAQNKDGTSNYSPQLMQSVIMNSMMTDFNFDLDNDKNK